MENLPHVAGKLWGLMYELMEGEGLLMLGLVGNEKFCTNLNFPECPGFGMMDNGNVWNGPIDSYIVVSGYGSMYLPLAISLLTISSSWSWYVLTDRELGGVCRRCMVGLGSQL